jgi:hypothetical protein
MAITELAFERDITNLAVQHAAKDARVQLLAQELGELVSTAILARAAIEEGSLSLRGATGAILERSLSRLEGAIDRSLDDIRVRREQSR